MKEVGGCRRPVGREVSGWSGPGWRARSSCVCQREVGGGRPRAVVAGEGLCRAGEFGKRGGPTDEREVVRLWWRNGLPFGK